jgi:hypothetical protein
MEPARIVGSERPVLAHAKETGQQVTPLEDEESEEDNLKDE